MREFVEIIKKANKAGIAVGLELLPSAKVFDATVSIKNWDVNLNVDKRKGGELLIELMKIEEGVSYGTVLSKIKSCWNGKIEEDKENECFALYMRGQNLRQALECVKKALQ